MDRASVSLEQSDEERMERKLRLLLRAHAIDATAPPSSSSSGEPAGGGAGELSALFRRLDADGDGTLSGLELRRFARSELGLALSDVELLALMRRFDADGDGTISFREAGARDRETWRAARRLIRIASRNN